MYHRSQAGSAPFLARLRGGFALCALLALAVGLAAQAPPANPRPFAAAAPALVAAPSAPFAGVVLAPSARPWPFPRPPLDGLLPLPPPAPAFGGQQKTARQSPHHGRPGHIFWIIPAFNVQYLHNVPPLTPREKFNEMARDAYDPQGLALSAGEALLEHGPDGFCGYGPGWSGYGKCYGAALLDANVSGFFGDYFFPVLLKQDPRYFRLGSGSIGTRIVYALSRVFITRTDAGGTAFDASALSGTVIAGAASNLYYPKADRGFGLTMSRIGVDLGGTALFNLEAEFWADIEHSLFGKPKPGPSGPPS